MPSPLSPRDQIAFYFDSLVYAANRTFMLEQRQLEPGRPSRRMNREELLEGLRTRLPRSVQVPTSHPNNDRERYAEMLSLIRAWRTSVNEKLRRSDAQTEKTIAEGVVDVMHQVFLEDEVVGCGDLCYEKDRGCVECPPPTTDPAS